MCWVFLCAEGCVSSPLLPPPHHSTPPNNAPTSRHKQQQRTITTSTATTNNTHSIPVAVLSVCSAQYKTVLDALRARRERFLFEDAEIALRPSVMAFITMNPGYPGRAGERRAAATHGCLKWALSCGGGLR